MAGMLSLVLTATVIVAFGFWSAARERRARLQPPTRTSAHDELEGLARCLNEDELEPVLFMARRIWIGRQQYGELRLNRDKRKWRAELRCELADAVAYEGWDGRSEG